MTLLSGRRTLQAIRFPSSKDTVMTSASATFFEDLARTGHVPLLQRVKGTMRFDLDDAGEMEHWYVAVDKGDVKVSRKKTSADVVVNTDRALLDDMVQGRVNATAAALRGLISAEGNLGLLMLFQRLFPGPSKAAAPKASAKRKEARS
jgi:putative sterol carrier protein